MDKKKELQTAITDFRKKYIGELEKCLKVAIEVRDDKKASPRDRNEAVKTISRLLGSLQPERIAPPQKQTSAKEAELPKEKQELIQQKIEAMLGQRK